MFYKKKGKPVIGEKVICTVRKILYHSIFVSIDEYENLEGMVHVSEIAPGRIRNLRDHVVEGRRIVCVVLNINREGQIDLSLRRVAVTARINKMKDYQNEEKAEKLVEQICKDFKIDLQKFYKTMGEAILEKYGGLYPFFQAAVENPLSSAEEFKTNPKLGEALLNTIREKIKPVEVSVGGTLVLRSYNSMGVDDVKKILLKLIEQNINVHYLGAPRYKLTITSKNYKEAEALLKNGLDAASDYAQKLKCELNFVKDG